MVNQGDVFRALGIPLRENGAQVLQTVVLVGHPCTAETDGWDGQETEAASGQYPDLPQTSDHECGG